MATVFDGPNLRVTLNAPAGGFLTVNAQRALYSEWKEWVKTSDAQYPQLFDVIGGDPIPGNQAISPSYFTRNDLGWRIQTTDADQSVTINGNVYPRDETIDMFVPRAGRQIVINLALTANPRDTTSQLVQAIYDRLFNKEYTNPVTNKLEQYSADGLTIIYQAPIWKDDGVTAWDGTGPIRRRDRMEAP